MVGLFGEVTLSGLNKNLIPERLTPTGVVAYSPADTLSASEYESGSRGREREQHTLPHVACFHRRGNVQECLHYLQTSLSVVLLIDEHKFVQKQLQECGTHFESVASTLCL